MAITVLPPRKTALDYMEPYLQLAFQTALRRKLDKEAFEREKQLKEIPTPLPPELAGFYKQLLGGQAPEGKTEPTIEIDPMTNLPKIGGLTIGGVSRSGVSFKPKAETPEEKQAREVETTKMKRSAEVAGETKAVDNMVNAVWQSAERLIPAPEDISEAERIGMSRTLKTANILGFRPQRLFGISDENALAFEQVKAGEATPLIRALGEKGMLTNQDIQRAYNLMPSFNDSQQLRNAKKRELTEFLKARIKAYEEVAGGVTETTQPLQKSQNIGRFIVEEE